MAKIDIKTEDDIRLLVNSFYEKATADAQLAVIFNDIAKVDWEHHLPRMYAFWEFMLLDKDTFRGNPMHAHADLAQKTDLNIQHFDQWVALFRQTVDEHFEGPIAEKAKFRAFAIAETWKPKFAIDAERA